MFKKSIILVLTLSGLSVYAQDARMGQKPLVSTSTDIPVGKVSTIPSCVKRCIGLAKNIEKLDPEHQKEQLLCIVASCFFDLIGKMPGKK